MHAPIPSCLFAVYSVIKSSINNQHKINKTTSSFNSHWATQENKHFKRRFVQLLECWFCKPWNRVIWLWTDNILSTNTREDDQFNFPNMDCVLYNFVLWLGQIDWGFARTEYEEQRKLTCYLCINVFSCKLVLRVFYLKDFTWIDFTRKYVNINI